MGQTKIYKLIFMFDLYKKKLSVIIWGILLVNIVQLLGSPSNEINSILFIFINIILWTTLIANIIRKYHTIKFIKIEIISLTIQIIIFIAFDYLTIKFLIEDIALYNIWGEIVVLFALVLLNISLFFEIKD